MASFVYQKAECLWLYQMLGSLNSSP